MESALYCIPKPSDSGDDGWTDENMAELEKELGLALEEEENSSASTPTSLHLRSIEAPQDKIQSPERTGATGRRLEEPQDASRCCITQGLEEWKQREIEVIEEGGVAMQEQEELAAQKEEPHVGNQQDLVEIVDVNNPKDKEATEALLATQTEIPKIDEHRFRLRGIRTQQLPEHQTKTTQYRVVWGEHLNRSDSWINKDDVQISILRLPCERSSQDLVPQVERDVRVRHMRCSKRSKSKKIFEYLVDELSTWVTKDQLRISLSPMLLAGLKGKLLRHDHPHFGKVKQPVTDGTRLTASSTSPLSPAQSEVYPMHPMTPINDEHRYISRTSRSPSSPANPALEGEPATRKRGHQDMHTKISGGTHRSVNTDDDHNTCDTDDEDLRPAKRRRPRSAPIVTAPLHLRRSPPFTSPSTTSLEIDEAQSQDYHRCSSTFIDEQHCALQTSRSPSVASQAMPLAEYQEWSFHSFLKRTKIRDDVTYILEFKLPSISEHLHLPINPAALGINHDAAAHSQIHQAPLKPKKNRVSWVEDDIKLAQMWKEGRSWEYIFAALPNRSEGSIRVRCSTKFKKRPRTGADHS